MAAASTFHAEEDAPEGTEVQHSSPRTSTTALPSHLEQDSDTRSKAGKGLGKAGRRRMRGCGAPATRPGYGPFWTTSCSCRQLLKEHVLT